MNPQSVLFVERHPLYLVILIFFGLYPILSSLVWISTSLLFYFRRERKYDAAFYALPAEAPLVSVLIPSYCERAVIRRTVLGVLAMDYPRIEVMVVDDASTDGTAEEIRDLVAEGKVRLLQKKFNEGKAMALNDALPCLNGEFVLIIDADAWPEPDLLRHLVPHFRTARVGAVTGNPKVANRETFLSKLQIVEFTSIVSVLRRAQRVWGRILTMSGVVGIFRRSALFDVGLYSPEMATEDIDISWKLQKRFYDIRYESRAVVWMQVPPTFARLWRQRVRWAKGLAQILRRHSDVLRQYRHRRLWPVIFEAVLSVLWAYTAVFLTAFWVVSYTLGHVPLGISPIPMWWGMLIATMCILQLLTGVLLERQYDREVLRNFPVAVFYPIVYWMMMAVVTALATPWGLFERARRGSVTRWRTERDPFPPGSQPPPK
ncbi:MAG: poly-beta-1,6 N-acetyl-D-glucosamine synthase [Candidatus Eisenbacteria bacterium]|nr:poly-beta-1,6 N-acetyl-D-glucosamine synthase [Candidatus Eisenbacteria bacterium]